MNRNIFYSKITWVGLKICCGIIFCFIALCLLFVPLLGDWVLLSCFLVYFRDEPGFWMDETSQILYGIQYFILGCVFGYAKPKDFFKKNTVRFARCFSIALGIGIIVGIIEFKDS